MCPCLVPSVWLNVVIKRPTQLCTVLCTTQAGLALPPHYITGSLSVDGSLRAGGGGREETGDHNKVKSSIPSYNWDTG